MIDIKNLEVFYGKEQILFDINLNIKPRQNIVIMGANGCGKTTLLKAMLNLVDFRGNIAIDGKDIRSIPRKDFAKKIGILNQINNMNFDYTVFDTVMLGRYVHQRDKIFVRDTKEDKEEVLKILDIVNMLDFKDRSILSLSGGQRQRVFFAKLIAQNPDIVLLDEPTNHLDIKYQIELVDFLKVWSEEEHKTIIGVLHDINLATMLTDDIVMMKDGYLLEFSNFKNLLSKDMFNIIYDANIKEYMKESLKKWQGV